MRATTQLIIIFFCWFALVLLLVGAMLGTSHISFGPTPKAVGRIPELQTQNK